MIKNREILKFFPQAIIKYKFLHFEKFNKELLDYIQKLKYQDNEGLQRSNVHGWHSKNIN